MDVDQRVTEMKGCDRSPETVLTRLWNKVTPDMRFVFLSTLIMGLITHLFVFTNKLINMDDLYWGYDNKGMQIGRWFVWLTTQITSDNYSMPWVIGFMSLVFISISTCLIVSIFDIRSRLNMLLIGGLMVTFLSVGSTFSYMFTAAAYFFSLMLSVWSVWLARKYRLGFIWGGVLLVFSLGIYQTYICMAIALFAICVLKETLEVDTDNRTLFIHIGKYLACGIIGVVGYYLILQFVFLFTGNTLTSHQGADQFAISSLIHPSSVVASVKVFVTLFFIDGYGSVEIVSWVFRIATLLVFVMIFIYTIRICVCKQRQTRNTFQVILALAILFTLPIWTNCIYLVPDLYMHGIVFYPYVTLYIVLIVLTEMSNRNLVLGSTYIGRWVSFCCIVSVVYVGYLATNELYLKYHLAYERTYAFVLRVIDRLEQMDELDLEHTPVDMVYVLEEIPASSPETFSQKISRYCERLKEPFMEHKKPFQAVRRFNQPHILINSLRFRCMSEQYFQKNFVASTKEDKEWRENSEVQTMPCFPAKDSIREIDGTIVVKISSESAGW